MTSKTSSDLISKEYRQEQRLLHDDPRGYGHKGRKWADLICALIERHGKPDAVLDYGCGRNTLADELAARGLRTRSYDPAIKQFAKLPKPSDFVSCTDVMEHLEPELVDSVLDHLAALTIRIGLFVISTVETAKLLSDGRQAHISLHDRDWWLAKLSCRFQIVQVLDDPQYRPEKQVVVIVAPKEC